MSRGNMTQQQIEEMEKKREKFLSDFISPKPSKLINIPTNAEGNDVIIKMKIPVKEYIKKRSIKNKVAHRDYVLQEVNYTKLKENENKINERKKYMHWQHQGLLKNISK